MILDGLFVYPVKSCRGIAVESAELRATGLAHDREWMIVTPDGRFVTQREEPRLATIGVDLDGSCLALSHDTGGRIEVPLDISHGVRGPRIEVTVWRDRCVALDEGDDAAHYLSALLGKRVRLVRFDPTTRRRSDPTWTGATEAHALFADGFALLAISRASLADLNARMDRALAMERFRPNLVLDGVPAYAEDQMHEVAADGVTLRVVKPCTRCRITTTDQRTGAVEGPEPLQTLARYRFDDELQGVVFGQNVIVVEGEGRRLRRGMALRATMRERH